MHGYSMSQGRGCPMGYGRKEEYGGMPMVPAPAMFFAFMIGLMFGIMMGRKKAMMQGGMGGMGMGNMGMGMHGGGMMMHKKMMMHHHHHGMSEPCGCREGAVESQTEKPPASS